MYFDRKQSFGEETIPLCGVYYYQDAVFLHYPPHGQIVVSTQSAAREVRKRNFKVLTETDIMDSKIQM